MFDLRPEMKIKQEEKEEIIENVNVRVN